MDQFEDNFGVYVINLARSAERMEKIADELDAVKVPFTRFDAVDGDNLNLEQPDIAAKIDFAYWRKYHHRNMLKSEIGCYLSHVGALKAFIASGKLFGVILEDDAEIHADFKETLEVLASASKHWDLVKLYASHAGVQRPRAQLDQERKLTAFLTQTGRATGYVISAEAAPRLLRQLHPIRLPFDHIFDRNFEHKLRLRGVTPTPIHPRNVPSVIEVHRVKQTSKSIFPRKWGDSPLLPRWRVPLYRLAVETRRLTYNLLRD